MTALRCWDCNQCGMDMDMSPYCVDKVVLADVTKETGREYSYGLNVNAARQACKGEQFKPRVWVSVENENLSN